MSTTHQNPNQPFVVACCSRKHVYDVSDVIRLEASSNYTLIHAVNQRPLVVARVLSAYEELLEGMGFIRVHRSHLVNRRYIQAIDGKGNLLLEDQSSIEVSRRRKKDVLDKLSCVPSPSYPPSIEGPQPAVAC